MVVLLDNLVGFEVFMEVLCVWNRVFVFEKWLFLFLFVLVSGCFCWDVEGVGGGDLCLEVCLSFLFRFFVCVIVVFLCVLILFWFESFCGCIFSVGDLVLFLILF